MRLVKAEIGGFGRLAEGKVNLDSRVIAIVGPNEAGKTTLLRALAYIDNGRVLPAVERSRGMQVADDATVVRVQYLLDDVDRASVEEFDLEEIPSSIWLSRTAGSGGGPITTVEPAPLKSITDLEHALEMLNHAATKKTLDELDVTPDEDDSEGNLFNEDTVRVELRSSIETALSSLNQDIELDGPRRAVSDHIDTLRESFELLKKYEVAESLQDGLAETLAWFDREDPAASVASRLYKRSPDILLFSESDRSLASTYALSEELVENMPPALSNLMKMAELDPRALWEALTSGDEGERETLIDSANRVLADKFAAAWKQSTISAVLKTENYALSVRIKQDGRRITQFDERSAGLKMFVALVAFLAVRNTKTPPVLLIDEAETHLHIDAQADLINTFMTQQQAAKIIYTTHSPACLPPDLGSNIRAVVPDPKHEYRSLIQSSFWHGAAGFSPLMLAMGAGAAAFSTARYVVLGEGASEMLLLPSLIKASVDVSDLDYQIAPGLSEVPPDMYPELDLAGARVAYILDGDKGGQDRKAELVAGGVPAERIVTLGALTLENLLESESYLKCVGMLLVECNPGVVIPELPALPDPDTGVWPNPLEQWAREHGLKMPGKRVVASRLVEEGLANPSDYGAPILRDAHRALQDVLKSSNALKS